ncbi:hypothetical protein DA075_35405, partial (plasmid) [Methylobacterium currus]
APSVEPASLMKLPLIAAWTFDPPAFSWELIELTRVDWLVSSTFLFKVMLTPSMLIVRLVAPAVNRAV